LLQVLRVLLVLWVLLVLQLDVLVTQLDVLVTQLDVLVTQHLLSLPCYQERNPGCRRPPMTTLSQ
jgi:hypothetical protein|tara:strand:+ start:120 stop:314 length:195 start_codon:yes stop_codon:yes gene_type:complete